MSTKNLLKSLVSSKLITSKIYLGHSNKVVNLKILYFVLGIRHNIIIFNVNKLLKNLIIIHCVIVEIVAKRGFFLLFGSNQNIPLSLIMNQFLKKYSVEYLNKKENVGFYITGYFSKNWIGGTFTNWKKASDFLTKQELLFTNENRNFNSYANLNLVSAGFCSLIPDFLFCFDSDKLLIKEASSLDIPIIGIIDSNDDFKNFFFKIIGNNDSLESIFFFCSFLEEAIQVGEAKHCEFFFKYIFKKFKSKLFLKLVNKYK